MNLTIPSSTTSVSNPASSPQIRIQTKRDWLNHIILNENNVFAYLESLGYDSSQLVKRNDY